MIKPVVLRSQSSAYPLPSDHAPGGWVVVGLNHTYHKVDAVTGYVYAHADGTRTVAELAAGMHAAGVAAADVTLVHEALDRLADAGLLAERVAPPAGVSRRVLLQRLVGGSALAALTLALGHARSAEAAPADVCGAELNLINEIAYLEAQEAAVADLLDTWADALDKDPKADPFYADALRNKEEEHKKRQQQYSAKLDDATDDLNTCKLVKEKAQEEKAKQRIQAQLKKRAEEQDKKKQAADTRFAERTLDIQTAEDKRKDAVKAKTMGEEQAKLAIQESLTHEAQRMERLKKRAAQEQDQKKQQRLRTEEQQVKASDRADFKFMAAEETEKAYADAYVLRAVEAAQKSAGVTDYALAVAKEENEKAWAEAPALRKQEEAKKAAAQEETAKAVK